MPWVSSARASELRTASRTWPSRALDARELGELEMMLDGLFEPVHNYLDEDDYQAVRERGVLADGTPFPRPLVLPVPGAALGPLALRDPEGVLIAVLEIEARFGEYVSGKLWGVARPERADFIAARRRPPARSERGRSARLGFFALDPITPATLTAIEQQAEQLDADVLLVAAAGVPTEFARLRALELVAADRPQTHFALVPATAALDAPTAARILRAMGATHQLVDEPDPAPEHGLIAVPYPSVRSPSPAELERRVARDEPLLEFPPEARPFLERLHQPRWRRGCAVLFSGLSGSGKSTLARQLSAELLARDPRAVTLLDGDEVRQHLSAGLGFTTEDRATNVRRIGFVASLIVRSGGIAVLAPIAPYHALRAELRARISAEGGFFLVHVSTSLEVCESRDRKGLYAKARAGQIPNFTGISDPYEAPEDADLTLDTATISTRDATDALLNALEASGYLRSRA